MNGVTATPDCFAAFAQMKLRKTNRFLIFRISEDERSIVVDERGGAAASFDEFCASIAKPSEARYAVLAISVKTKSGATDPNRLLFVGWCGAEAPVRAKMLHASSKAALKRGLEGLSSEFNASRPGELCFGEMYLKAGGVPDAVNDQRPMATQAQAQPAGAAAVVGASA